MTCANDGCNETVPDWRRKYCCPKCGAAANRRAKMDLALDTERCRIQPAVTPSGRRPVAPCGCVGQGERGDTLT